MIPQKIFLISFSYIKLTKCLYKMAIKKSRQETKVGRYNGEKEKIPVKSGRPEIKNNQTYQNLCNFHKSNQLHTNTYIYDSINNK